MTGIDACMRPRGMWGVAWRSLSPVDIIGCLGDLYPVATASKSLYEGPGQKYGDYRATV